MREYFRLTPLKSLFKLREIVESFSNEERKEELGLGT